MERPVPTNKRTSPLRRACLRRKAPLGGGNRLHRGRHWDGLPYHARVKIMLRSPSARVERWPTLDTDRFVDRFRHPEGAARVTDSSAPTPQLGHTQTGWERTSWDDDARVAAGRRGRAGREALGAPSRLVGIRSGTSRRLAGCRTGGLDRSWPTLLGVSGVVLHGLIRLISSRAKRAVSGRD
jgi:hypothetical protein